MSLSLRVVLVAATATAVVSGAAVAWAAGGDGPALTGADRAAAQLAPPMYQPASESTFVPITPCQVVNTRRTHHRLANKTKTYLVAGSGSAFAGQGGHPGGCGIPAGATGASLNLVATARKSGSLRMAEAGATPNQTVLAYRGKQTTTGQVTMALATSSVVVRNVGGPTHLTVVVTGYYEKPLAGFISPTGSPYSGSSRILDAAKVGTGVYEVQFDRDIRYCSAVATPYVSNYYASATTWYDSTRPDTLRVYVWTAEGAAADQYVYVQVQC